MIRAAILLGTLASATAASSEPMVVDHGRLFVRATLNGVATEALLDSGAETSLVDPALAARVKLAPGEEIELKGSGGVQKARVVEGVTITAGGVTLKDRTIVVSDLTEVSKRLIKRPTQMIVGRELFDSARLRVDIGRSTWSVLRPSDRPRGTALPLTGHAGIEAAPVRVNGVSALADFDLGNGSRVLISRALAAKLKLKPVGSVEGGGLGGPLRRELVRLDRLTVGGRTFRNVAAAIDPLPNAGDLNIGTAILRHFVVTTDFAGHKVYLQSRERR